jgi:hypothetical protein
MPQVDGTLDTSLGLEAALSADKLKNFGLD